VVVRGSTLSDAFFCSLTILVIAATPAPPRVSSAGGADGTSVCGRSSPMGASNLSYQGPG